MPGAVLPALIERTNPQLVKILWDEAPAAAPASVVNAGPGTTVNIVGDVSKLTPEQKEKLKAMGIDVDALGAPRAEQFA